MTRPLQGSKMKVSWYACCQNCALMYMSEWPESFEIIWDVGIREKSHRSITHASICPNNPDNTSSVKPKSTLLTFDLEM